MGNYAYYKLFIMFYIQAKKEISQKRLISIFLKDMGGYEIVLEKGEKAFLIGF